MRGIFPPRWTRRWTPAERNTVSPWPRFCPPPCGKAPSLWKRTSSTPSLPTPPYPDACATFLRLSRSAWLSGANSRPAIAVCGRSSWAARRSSPTCASSTPVPQNLPGADLRLFDALDAEGRVTASLLLDFAPERFVSYVIGAHSRSHYAPHATDLLFKVMLEAARAEGREEIQLGLGVNEGITRFKRKWGGVPALPYAMGEWHFSRRGEASAGGGGSGASRSPSRRTDGVADELVRAMLTPGRISKWEFMLRQPEQRPLAMLWELEKNGRVSWIAGSAHFCRCSFRRSLTRLFEKVDTVNFEGTLDVDSLLETADYGEIPPPPGERAFALRPPDA